MAIALCADAVSAQEKITVEELLGKHLDSIGAAADRSATRSIMSVGTTKAVFRGRGAGTSEGVVVIASEKEKNLIGMKFNNSTYPFEKMGYDGNEFTIGYVTPGVPSTLGQFLRINENAFKHGILGGTLSTSWELLNFNEGKAKLKYGGLEKVGGKKLHKLKYEPKKGSELAITLFFDPDTFQHVRTEYKRTTAASIGGTVDSSAGQSESRYTLVEEFSDFKKEGKLNLPHAYRLFLEIITGNGTATREWTMNLQKFSFNQAIDPKEFKVDSY
jgi:hypothetical protein